MSKRTKRIEPDALSVTELASRAQVDRRTALKALRGAEVRGLAGARIARALTVISDEWRVVGRTPSPANDNNAA